MCGIAYNVLALFTIATVICLHYYVLTQLVSLMNQIIVKAPTKDNNWGWGNNDSNNAGRWGRVGN
ncbi:hypothetical protein EW026_g4608 [Hermanssonia centrifuga]|uniref:Uncharacterized protein n=1 Tax=Hermanssonia centrifuga TaxID=98765 RepID=A0A4V3XAA4_9APHY|nr:hypothetical protein EW026_g4608 [Hermanssonia centrifuga]